MNLELLLVGLIVFFSLGCHFGIIACNYLAEKFGDDPIIIGLLILLLALSCWIIISIGKDDKDE